MTGTPTKPPPLLTVADFRDWPGDRTVTRYGYHLVHSTGAELLRRDEGHWPANPEPIGPGGTIRGAAIGREPAIGASYAGTHLVATTS